jgi:hypothetical protein
MKFDYTKHVSSLSFTRVVTSSVKCQSLCDIGILAHCLCDGLLSFVCVTTILCSVFVMACHVTLVGFLVLGF